MKARERIIRPLDATSDELPAATQDKSTAVERTATLSECNQLAREYQAVEFERTSKIKAKIAALEKELA